MKIAICIRYCIYFAYEKCAEIAHTPRGPIAKCNFAARHDRAGQVGVGSGLQTNAQVAGRKLFQPTASGAQLFHRATCHTECSRSGSSRSNMKGNKSKEAAIAADEAEAAAVAMLKGHCWLERGRQRRAAAGSNNLICTALKAFTLRQH